MQDQSFETTGENIRKELKAARNELDTIVNGKVSKNSSEYKNAKHKYDLWKAIADVGYISDNLGKNKVTGNFGKDKNKNGREEDDELKRLQERLSSLKSARQMYQKYKSIMPNEEAKKKTYNLFPEVTGLNLDDYQKAVHSLLEGFSINTTERKKFQTSIYREVAEWLFDEKDKKEYEKKAADFSESMNKLSERWDLYKSLLEKTGSKFFAESAWVDAFQMDDKVQSLMDEYYAHYHEIFNLQDSLSMTDGEAKEKLKLPNQYEEWKKITQLLRGNYVKSLQDAPISSRRQKITRTRFLRFDRITINLSRRRMILVSRRDMRFRETRRLVRLNSTSSRTLLIISISTEPSSLSAWIRLRLSGLESGRISTRLCKTELSMRESTPRKSSSLMSSYRS